MQILLLNGPPRSGKDTMAEALTQCLPNSRIEKFARPIKDGVAGIYFGGNYSEFAKFDTSEMKDVAHDIFLGKTCRECQIAISETFIKKFHNPQAFGQLLAKRIAHSPADHIVVSDSGFREEAEELIRNFGSQNVKLIRLYRPGFDYSGDSRSYIELDDLNVKSYNIMNLNGEADVTFKNILAIAEGN